MERGDWTTAASQLSLQQKAQQPWEQNDVLLMANPSHYLMEN
jgi:hypothetical protein